MAGHLLTVQENLQRSYVATYFECEHPPTCSRAYLAASHRLSNLALECAPSPHDRPDFPVSSSLGPSGRSSVGSMAGFNSSVGGKTRSIRFGAKLIRDAFEMRSKGVKIFSYGCDGFPRSYIPVCITSARLAGGTIVDRRRTRPMESAASRLSRHGTNPDSEYSSATAVLSSRLKSGLSNLWRYWILLF